MQAFVDLRPLRETPAFRRLWLGNTLSIVGGQLTMVAVLYQTWSMTDSTVAVGAIGIAQAIPTVVLGLIGGSLADAIDRRRLVLATTVGQIVASGLLAAQAYAGLDSLPVLLGLVAFHSGCGGLGAPARRTFPVRLLPDGLVSAGVALNHLSFQISMLVGPALAGVVMGAGGVRTCYLIDTLTFVAALYGVTRLPSIRPQLGSAQLGSAQGGPTRPSVGAIWSSWRFIGTQPVLRGAFLIDLLATVMAMPLALFPTINDERFGGDPETLGLFFSAIALGGIVAGAMSGLATRSARPAVVMLVAASVWGVGLAGFGLAQQLWLALGCLAIAGAADTTSVITRGSIVQRATPDSQRGRVSAVEHIVGVSGPHMGNFRGGLVAGVTSATLATVSGGLLCAAGIGVIAASNRALRRFTVRQDEREPAMVD
ncbi:MAG TPA: MFS transporter [Nocardioidaceae bacterium]|nr:MFS transporter [Nocardioidaceae bacterium]